MIFIASAWHIAGPKNVLESIAFCAITGFEPPVRFVVDIPQDRELNDDPLDQTLNDLVDDKVNDVRVLMLARNRQGGNPVALHEQVRPSLLL